MTPLRGEFPRCELEPHLKPLPYAGYEVAQKAPTILDDGAREARARPIVEIGGP